MDIRESLGGAIDAVEIRSSTTFAWFRRPSHSLRRAVEQALPPSTRREFLLHSLHMQLYQEFYCRGYAMAGISEDLQIAVRSENSDFLAKLSAANCGQGYWSRNWTVTEVGLNSLIASKDGVSVIAEAGDYLEHDGVDIKSGAKLNIRYPKELRAQSPGFYMACGDHDLHNSSPGLLRLYWNTTPAGAVAVMRSLTRKLNGLGVPFRLKAIDSPGMYVRCDAVVLYVPISTYRQIREILQETHSSIDGELRDMVPAFTKPLARGLGLAEDPNGFQSFGLHRCKLVAEGLVRAYETRSKQHKERYEAIARCFAELGINLERPYLNSGSSNNYEFKSLAGPAQIRNSSDPRDLQPDFFEASRRIGMRLAEEAWWHDGRCNWLSHNASGGERGRNVAAISYGSLPCDMYGGTSGVAIFLAELWARSGEGRIRQTALGAMRHAIATQFARKPEDAYPVGLFTGWTGVALAAARVGQLLRDDELLKAASSLVSLNLGRDRDDGNHELLSGHAGAIIALLALRPLIESPNLLDRAMELGTILLEAAEKSHGQYSWKYQDKRSRNLTGMSHGAAGIGTALVELYGATAESRFRAAAEAAFAYEHKHFDKTQSNWPDFRGVPRRQSNQRHLVACGITWCHGAPGIALSRIRAGQVLDTMEYRAEAAIAAQTTFMATRNWHQTDSHASYCLCHGLAGNADILVDIRRAGLPNSESGYELALEIGNAGIERYLNDRMGWPCGLEGAENFSLMLGLAGIGYFYLRLHDPSVPSLLLIHQDSFKC